MSTSTRSITISRISALATLCWIAVAQACAGAAEPAGGNQHPSDGQTLRVTSYNVQFLPGPAALANKRPDTPYRAKTIGTLLAKFDLVGLNEVFDDRPRTLLLEQLKAAWGPHYQEIVIPKPDDTRFMGGVAIAGRSKFLATHHLLYSVGSSREKYGLAADGFAAKGAVHARIARGGSHPPTEFVDVFVTHLESKDDEIRQVQYRELADFVRREADPTHPVILMGDMNTCGNPRYQQEAGSPYNQMLRIYNAARAAAPFVDLWPALHPDQLGGTNEQESSEIGNRIDYILLSNPPAGHSRLVPKSVRVNGYLDPKVVALSDHSAVEAELEWQDAR